MSIIVRRLLLAGICAFGTLCAPVAQAQRRRAPEFEPNVAYDGRFTWVRVKYMLPDLSSGSGFRGGRDLPWSHDYPRGERNFTKILSTLSTARIRLGSSNILTLDVGGTSTDVALIENLEPRRVRTEPLDATRVRVVQGLAGGERVVTEGAALLGQFR